MMSYCNFVTVPNEICMKVNFTDTKWVQQQNHHKIVHNKSFLHIIFNLLEHIGTYWLTNDCKQKVVQNFIIIQRLLHPWRFENYMRLSTQLWILFGVVGPVVPPKILRKETEALWTTVSVMRCLYIKSFMMIIIIRKRSSVYCEEIACTTCCKVFVKCQFTVTFKEHKT